MRRDHSQISRQLTHPVSKPHPSHMLPGHARAMRAALTQVCVLPGRGPSPAPQPPRLPACAAPPGALVRTRTASIR
eukprot:3378275-Rhodomonas_salina.1